MTEPGITISAVYVLAILGGAGGVIAFLFKLLISSKDALLSAKEAEFRMLLDEKSKVVASLESQQKSYEELAEEALKRAIEMANFYRAKEGREPIVPIAAVVPESHSPPTAQQRTTANIATMRALMAHLQREEDQVPRKESS